MKQRTTAGQFYPAVAQPSPGLQWDPRTPPHRLPQRAFGPRGTSRTNGWTVFQVDIARRLRDRCWRGEGMLYANNLYVANRNGYQLNENDVAVVVCLRHFATVCA